MRWLVAGKRVLDLVADGSVQEDSSGDSVYYITSMIQRAHGIKPVQDSRQGFLWATHRLSGARCLRKAHAVEAMHGKMQETHSLVRFQAQRTRKGNFGTRRLSGR